MELAFSDIWYWFIVMAVVSYFVGCFNFALLISKIKHKDVRKMGSGNPGTMNMSRQFGLKIGGLTLFLDMVKGGLPLLIAYFIFRGYVFAGTDVLVSDLARYVCGVSVIVGHIYPVTMKFKGGKGIASTLGMYAFALCCETEYPWMAAVVFGILLLLLVLGSWMMVNLTDGSRETVDTAKAYIQEQGFTFPVYFDTQSEAANSYGVMSIPTTFFIDAQGYMVAYGQGALDAETLARGIGMLLPAE